MVLLPQSVMDNLMETDQESDGSGRRGNPKERMPENQLNSDRRMKRGSRLHTGIQEKSTSMEDANWSALSTQYLPSLRSISKVHPWMASEK
jgi:hypothetical protein